MSDINKSLEEMIKENEWWIMLHQHFIDDRPQMIHEIHGELRDDATIAFDTEYLQETLDEEVEAIDKQIEQYEQDIVHYKKDNAFLKALLKA